MRFSKNDQELLAEAYNEVLEEGLRNKLIGGGLALAGLAGGLGLKNAMSDTDNKQPGIEQSTSQEYKIGDSLITVFKAGGSTVIEVKTDISKSLGDAKGKMIAQSKNKQHAEKVAEKLGFASYNLNLDTDNSENTGDYVLRYYKVNPDAKKLNINNDSKETPGRVTAVSASDF